MPPGRDPAQERPVLGEQLRYGNAELVRRLMTSEEAGSEADTQTPYVDLRGRDRKAEYLVGLMDDSRSLLDANDVSTHMETKLAAIMTNEGSRNLRRKNLGDGFMRDARSLKRKLGKRDPLALQADPRALQRFEKRLSEDERALFDKVKSGGLNLADLDSKDRDTRDRFRETVTETGIELRADQYEQMQELMDKKQHPRLTTTQRRRLRSLQRIGGSRELGMGGRMGGLWGMSRDRFAEIYEEGQQRFEPVQYRALRDSYRRGLKRQKRPGAPVPFQSGIGRFEADSAMQEQLGDNHDLIADMATSYGTAQIMGAYAQQGDLTAKDAEGNDHAVTLDELKDSGDRLSPTSDDVLQQLAFMNMKGVDLSSTNMSDSQLTRKYNGSRPGTSLYNQYMRGLRSGSTAYTRARRRANRQTEG